MMERVRVCVVGRFAWVWWILNTGRSDTKWPMGKLSRGAAHNPCFRMANPCLQLIVLAATSGR